MSVTLEITIQRKAGKAWPVIAERNRPEAFLPVRQEGLLQLDKEKINRTFNPQAYGTLLGQAVFQDEIRDAFIAALNEARSQADGYLRVLLFVEAEDLKMLHWQRLCAPLDAQWEFLALQQQTPFSLYLPSLTDRRFPAFGRRDLRALLLVANPKDLPDYDLAPFDEQQTIASLRNALGDLPCDVLGLAEGTIAPPSLDALCQQLTIGHYTLLHVVCHGRLIEGDTALYLSDAQGMTQPVTASDFIRRMGLLRGATGLPHLAFFSTCESASPQAEAGLGGLGQRLVRELGMPAVIAMSERVSLATAEALASHFYRQLRQHGQVDRALSEAAAGLAGRLDVTVPALFSRLGGQALFSQELDRPLTATEIKDGLGRLQALLQERAPVLLAEFETSSAVISTALESDIRALSQAAQRERQAALDKLNEISSEACDLSFNALAFGQDAPAYDPRCPFRGLYPFRQEDQEFFFGRETLVEALVQRVQEFPFLALLGPSGSGKSSIVMAGLVPALQTRNPDMKLAYLTPGEDPPAQLQATWAQIGTVNDPLVLVVDQFEELFTLCKDENKRQAFIASLLEPAAGRLTILTMRADFWGECAPYPELRAAMQAHQELVAAMDFGELRRAMELQAGKVGLRFEAGVTSSILDDVHGEPGAMPLMQHALLLLWQRRRGRWLRAGEYQAIGGVQRAIASTADQVFDTLDTHERERMRDIFVRLTRLDDSDLSAGERRDTRRRVGFDELVPAGGDPVETRRLVERLADARLVVTSRNQASGREEVEVAHEALIRHWPRLSAWLDDDRDKLRLREGLRDAALEWQAGERDEGLLVHRAGRLDDVLELSRQPRFAPNEMERAYLDACTGLRERERTEKEALQRRELEAAQKLAAEQKSRADEQERASARLRKQAIGLALALVAALLLAASTLFFLGEASRNAGEARLQRITAEHNASIALDNAATATYAQGQAEQQQATAEYNAQVAARNAAEAQRQATISLSRQLASQALGALLDGKQDLALLLAVQAQKITDTLQSRGALLSTLQEQPRLRKILTGHPDYVISIAYSPDGNILASSGCHEFDRSREKCLTGEVRLWNYATGQPLVEPLLDHKDLVSMVAFSPDGSTLASAEASGLILLRDAASGAPTGLQLEGHTERIGSLVFTPDSQRLFSIDSGKSLIEWDLSSGKRAGDPLIFEDNVVMAIALDGSRLATTRPGAPITVLDLSTRTQLLSIPIPIDGEVVTGLAYRQDGSLAASLRGPTQTSPYAIVIFSPDGASAGRINLQYAPGDLLFSPVGGELAYTQAERIIQIADVQHVADPEQNYLAVPELRGHTELITSLAFSPDGRFMASASRDRTIRIWEWQAPDSLGQPQDEAPPLLYSADGKLAARSRCREQSGDTCKQGEIILLDALTNLPIGEPLVGHTDLINNLAFSPDDRLLASGSWDSTILLWDVTSRQQFGAPLDGHNDFVTGLAFSPDGTRLVSSSRDGFVILWDVASQKELLRLNGHSSQRVLCVDFSPDGRSIASGGVDNQVVLWDISAGEPISHTLSGHTNQVNSVVFSPLGRYLASADSNGRVYLWDTSTAPATSKFLNGHTKRVNNLAFSPDGHILASGGWDSRVILWETATGQMIGDALKGHSGSVNGLGFIPDSALLVSTADDSQVLLWDLSVQNWMARACNIASRNLSTSEWDLYLPDEPYQQTCPQ